LKVKPKVLEPVNEYEYVAYNCSACTFANADKPGKTCQICGTAAPESAKILKENPINAQLK
jgi:rRNA maturation endonuclease Nob1